MKSAEPKSSTSSALQRKSDNVPFFQQEESREAFFGSKQADTPFFKPAQNNQQPIQTKLKIGAPDDHFEREADATADKVVQRLAESPLKGGKGGESPLAVQRAPSVVQRKCATCEQEELQKQEDLSSAPEQVQMKPIFDSAAEPPPSDASPIEGGTEGEIRRKPIFESNQEEMPPLEGGQEGDIQRKCAACEAEEKEQVQKSGEQGASGASEASPDVASRLQSSKGGGSPLPDGTRSDMEGAFGADFSNVRIHTGSEAAGMSKDLHAQAFTHGSDIYFNSGKYDTGSTEGKKLLAHELTHTVQQLNNFTIRKQESSEELLKNQLGLANIGIGAQGPVQKEVYDKAIQNLNQIRTLFADIHADVNSVFLMLNNLEGIDANEIFTGDFWILPLTEGLDAAGVAAPEKAEAGVTIIAKILKIIILTAWKYKKTKEKNAELALKNKDISFLLELLQDARIQVDNLKSVVQYYPDAASTIANIQMPENIGKKSKAISGEIEFGLYQALLKRKGAVLKLRTTDQLNVNTSKVKYENTQHYKKAKERHKNPVENWYLYNDWPEAGWLPFHPTADTAYSWKVLIIEEAAKEAIQHVLTRMSTNGIPKSRLYDIFGTGSLPMEEASSAVWSQVNVIE